MVFPLNSFRKILLLLPIFLFSIIASAYAKDKIIYIPLDNRPVCLSYVAQTVTAAGYELITPPKKALASNKRLGNPEAMWRWLNTVAPEAKAAVVATDSLIYGGLVASRLHHESDEKLFDRVSKFSQLKADNPNLKIYGFSTFMRTPRQSFGNIEPPYYSVYGPGIFALSQLYDKEDIQPLTKEETASKNDLLRRLPQNYLNDWFERRQRNYQINLKLSNLARNKTFHYLAIGKDDDAPLSQTHMESRHLSAATFDLSDNHFQILPGVDQLGLLLLTRTITELNNERPLVHVIYSEGSGKQTLPLYSDQRLASSIPDQVQALGGSVTALPGEADLILAVNTPFEGITKDSTADDNLFFSSVYNKRFVKEISEFVEKNYQVALADVSYANGADNGFMQELSKNKLLSRLVAYSGWNTADNTVGYALSQGVLAKKMSEKAKNTLLQVRYFDDWLYQANIRPTLSHIIDKYDLNLKYDLGNYYDDIVASANKLYEHQVKKDPFLEFVEYKVDFPWNRLFEVNINIQPKK